VARFAGPCIAGNEVVILPAPEPLVEAAKNVQEHAAVHERVEVHKGLFDLVLEIERPDGASLMTAPSWPSICRSK
jgi:hypothetical protein